MTKNINVQLFIGFLLISRKKAVQCALDLLKLTLLRSVKTEQSGHRGFPMISATGTPSMSPSVSEAASSGSKGIFNSRTAHCSTPPGTCLADAGDDVDRDERRPLAESAAMMRAITLPVPAADPAGPALSPPNTEARLQHVLKMSLNQGLIHEPQLIARIDQLGTDITEPLRLALEQEILLELFVKHVASFRETIKAFSQVKDKPKALLIRAKHLLGYNNNALSNAFKDRNPSAIKAHLSNLDLLFSMLNDFVNLLQQKTCSAPLSQMYYIDKTSYAKTDLVIEQKQALISGRKDDGLTVHLGDVVVSYACYQSNFTDQSIVQLVDDTCAFWQLELQIGMGITKSSAGALKSYLNHLGINRLYLPMAGSGYFARVMADQGMSVTCSDLTPPNKTFIHVQKSEVLSGLRQFAKTLATLKQSPKATAVTFDAPPFMFASSREDPLIPAAKYLPKVVKLWFEQGGNYLLVFSSAADLDVLFSSAVLSALSIRLELVLPGFSSDIYLGLGACVGSCGVFRICPGDQEAHT